MSKPPVIETRPVRPEDISFLVELNKNCFPTMVEENVVWSAEAIRNHLRVFPQGQIAAVIDGRVVGAVHSLIVDMGSDPHRPHTYAGITDGGYFHNHDPQGDSLYGADVYVDPDCRSLGVGRALYEARRELCRSMNLRRIIAGGRLYGYHQYAREMSPEEYVRKVENGELKDLVLSFQLREGFVVRTILQRYIRDPLSLNYATFIEWLNPAYKPLDPALRNKPRVACVQYKMRRVANFESFAEQVEYFVETAADYKADFVLFPEFFSVQLLSQPDFRKLPALDGIARLADLEKPFIELMTRLARENGVYIIAGSHPIRRGEKIYNVCPIISPDGSSIYQPKLHITPSEKRHWGITGGDQLHVIATPKARIGVQICYDVEFPEATRYLADQGIEILFVPYCTDDRQGHKRVNLCAQARAVENQIFVVTAGVIGNLPSVPAMDIHYGQAAVYCPSDFFFARDGVQAIADPNVEMLLISDCDVDDIYKSRKAGSVTPRMDRRRDLFDFVTRLSNHPAPGEDFSTPMELPLEE